MVTYDIACASHRTNARPEALGCGKIDEFFVGSVEWRRLRCGERGAASAGRKDERFREYFCIRRKLLDERLISSQEFSSSVRMVLLFELYISFQMYCE